MALVLPQNQELGMNAFSNKMFGMYDSQSMMPMMAVPQGADGVYSIPQATQVATSSGFSALGQSVLSSSNASQVGSLQNLISRMNQPSHVKPEEEKEVCTFYMRTGTCAYGDRCKFKHPRDRPQPVLNSRGYPLRPGSLDCAHYLKKGWCAFGLTCKFHHPELPAVLPGAPTGQVGQPLMQNQLVSMPVYYMPAVAPQVPGAVPAGVPAGMKMVPSLSSNVKMVPQGTQLYDPSQGKIMSSQAMMPQVLVSSDQVASMMHALQLQ